jgi:putative transcriptional regulator
MSEITENMRELAESLQRVGAIDDITMKAMRELCLPEVRRLGMAEVRAIRKKTRMSQPVFAAFIGVSPSAVAQWERGVKSPSGPAARLLDIIDRKGAAAIA